MIDWSAGTSDRGELSAVDAGIVELRVDTMMQVQIKVWVKVRAL